MNRADLVKSVLLYDQLAAAAKARAAIFREQLDTAARAELEEQGMAPTWRLTDVGTVTLPVSQPAIVCTNPDARLVWAIERHPDAVELLPTLKPSFVAALERRLAAADESAVDTESGEVVPGYTVRHGGLPGSLSIRPNADARALSRQYADGLLERFEAELTGDELADGVR